jgi:hypothetical protein
MKNPLLENVLKRYDYIQIANLNNLIENIADRNNLVYLDTHPEIEIIAHAMVEVTLT